MVAVFMKEIFSQNEFEKECIDNAPLKNEIFFAKQLLSDMALRGEGL